MGFLKVLDFVERCSTNEDGAIIYKEILSHIERGQKVTVSFSGVNGVPTSFVNSAFIELLERFPFDKIKEMLMFVDTTHQINDVINRRFRYEVSKVCAPSRPECCRVSQ